MTLNPTTPTTVHTTLTQTVIAFTIGPARFTSLSVTLRALAALRTLARLVSYLPNSLLLQG